MKFFLASTSEVYGKNPKPAWTEEDDLVFGATTKARWSYGASKAIDEFLALACWREFRLPVVIGRFFNVVGPRQTGAYGMVLPRFVEAALARPAAGRPRRRPADPLLRPRRRRRGRRAGADGHRRRAGPGVQHRQRPARLDPGTGPARGRAGPIASPVEFQSYADAYDEDFEDVRRRVPDLTRLHHTIPHRNRYDLEAIIRAVIAYTAAKP